MHRRFLLGLGPAVALLAFAAAAHARLATAPGDNGAKFNAQGPGGLAIVGKSDGAVTVAEDGGNVTVTVALKDLDTGIGLRNKHMREKYLEVDKYPNAVLVLPRSAIQAPAPGAGGSGSATGAMTLHGVTKPVAVQWSARNDGGTFRVNGTAALNMNDFGIQVPSYLGVTVKPQISVEIRFAATDAAQ